MSEMLIKLLVTDGILIVCLMAIYEAAKNTVSNKVLTLIGSVGGLLLLAVPLILILLVWTT